MSDVPESNLPAETVSAPVVPPVASFPDTSPELLPPVEPPSAGFIMQLFLVPGLIVAAVIGVWALFGQLSSGEQDWRQLITELRSTNEHRRWRGATALAQVLRADTELGESGQKLATNPQIAKELADLMSELLQQNSLEDKELISQQSFVVRTLGWLDQPEAVFPPLMEAMDAKYDPLVRTDALKSIAMIGGRHVTAETPLNHPPLIERVVAISQDPEPLVRQVAAYTLGLLSGEEVLQRLRVMAEDPDLNTRMNAALALTRQKRLDGFNVLVAAVSTSHQAVDPTTMEGATDAERKVRAESQQTMNAVSAINALKGLREMASQLNHEQKAKALEACETAAKQALVPRLKMEADLTAKELKSSP